MTRDSEYLLHLAKGWMKDGADGLPGQPCFSRPVSSSLAFLSLSSLADSLSSPLSRLPW